MPVFIGRSIPTIRLVIERRSNGIQEPVLTTLGAVVRNALGLQNCLNKVLGRGAFGQRNIACRAPTRIVPVDIGTDNIGGSKHLTGEDIGVSTIHKGDGVTLLELVGTGANVGELAIYVEAPIALGRSIPAIGLTIKRRSNAVEEPAPRRFASIESKAGLLKEILGSRACLETRLARRSPNLLLAVLVLTKHLNGSMNGIRGQLVAPATVEPRDGIANMDGDIVRRIVTRLAVDEQLPIGRIILGRTQFNTVVLKAQNEGARSNGVDAIRLKRDLRKVKCARAGRHHILRVIDPGLSLALGIATNDGHICGNLVLNDRGRATSRIGKLNLLPLGELDAARANRGRRAVDEQLPVGIGRRIVGKRAAIARGCDAFEVETVCRVRIVLRLEARLLLQLNEGIRSRRALVELELRRCHPGLSLAVSIGADNRERDLDLLLGNIAGFCRVLCLNGSRGGRSHLASGCRRRLLARGRALPRRRAFVASCCLCCGCTSCRRALGIRNLGAALLSGTARKRCVLARRRSLSHSLGNALGALGPQLSRCGAKGHREGQECHQAALGYAARNCATAMRDALALVLKHIHLSPTVCTWSVALRLPHVIAHVALEFPHRGPPSLQSPMHTGGKSRSRMQDGRRSDLTLTTRARRPICDASIPSQEELRLLVQLGTCTPILPNAQDNRAFVRLRTTI